MVNRPRLGLLTAQQFARDCEQIGLPILAEHTEWILNNGLIEPLTKVGSIPYYNVYQLYLLDVIQDRRLQSLNYPRTRGVTRTGKKLNSSSPGILWQDHLFLNKDSILSESKKWNPIAQILLDIQILHNNLLHKAFKNKEVIEEKIDFTFPAVIKSEGGIAAREILERYPMISEEILRSWKNNVIPAFLAKHNPMIRLLSSHSTLWDILHKGGGHVDLLHFYLSVMSYLDFYISCLTGGKEPDIRKIFIKPHINKVCPICNLNFTPNINRKGGRLQKLCGSKECEQQWRKQEASQYRKRKSRILS
jgi:hypothetical protein